MFNFSDAVIAMNKISDVMQKQLPPLAAAGAAILLVMRHHLLAHTEFQLLELRLREDEVVELIRGNAFKI